MARCTLGTTEASSLVGAVALGYSSTSLDVLQATGSDTAALATPTDLGHKLRFLEREVGQMVGAERIYNCSSKERPPCTTSS